MIEFLFLVVAVLLSVWGGMRYQARKDDSTRSQEILNDHLFDRTNDLEARIEVLETKKKRG